MTIRPLIAVVAVLAIGACSSPPAAPPLAASASAASDPGVAECKPFSREVQVGATVDQIAAADAVFQTSLYEDLRDDAQAMTGTYTALLSGSTTTTTDDVDRTLLNLWSTCADHGVKVAPIFY